MDGRISEEQESPESSVFFFMLTALGPRLSPG